MNRFELNDCEMSLSIIRVRCEGESIDCSLFLDDGQLSFKFG